MADEVPSTPPGGPPAAQEGEKEGPPSPVVPVPRGAVPQLLELLDSERSLRKPPRTWLIASSVSALVATFAVLVLLLRQWHPPAGRQAPFDPTRHSTEVGMVAFGCAFILFTCSLICRTDKEKRTAAFLVCYINAIAFSTNMLLYYSATPVVLDFFGRPCFPVRYVQWLHTTPTMIFMAAKISSFTSPQVVVAVLYDMLMLATGLTASLAPSWPVMAAAISCSCAAFLAVLVLVWNMFRSALREARDLASYRNLQFLQAHMVFTWNIFPLVWALSALHVITPETEAYLYLAGDLSAKVVFSALLLEGSFLSIEEKRRAAAAVQEENSKNALIAELRQAVSQKDRFLASVSHELRTPLNGIIGLSDTVLQGSCGPVTEVLLHTLGTIKKSGHRLQNLVNDILDVSSARSGPLVLRYDRVKLRPCVDHVLDLTTPSLKWSVKLHNDVPAGLPELQCDPARLIQVLHNIVGNAAKFTDEGEIRVSARLRKNQTGQDVVAVTVKDTGIGIPAERIADIFSAFEQGSDAIVQQHGGTGLGLSLAETLVRAHHGSISVTSRLGEGSAFTFVLPLVQPKREKEESAPEEPEPSRSRPPSAPSPQREADRRERASSSADSAASDGEAAPKFARSSLTKFQRESASGYTLKQQITGHCASEGFEDGAGRLHRSFFDVNGQYEILSVDDDPVNQMVVEGMLRPAAYKITKKMDGMEALAYLERSDTTPDLILLDVMMPGLSGYEVCRKVRQMFPASALPVIMVSAKSQEGDIVEGLKAGANDYLTKPFKRLEILARIETQLKIKKLWKVEMEAAKSYQLLKKMLPESIIHRLNSGQSLIADSHPEVTILFSDIVGFTEIAGCSRTADLIFMLNDMFTGFDELVDKHGVYKVETIGDAYMVVAGHDGAADHAGRVLRMAMDMLALVHAIKQPNQRESVRIRIGVHSGPAYAGVIGVKCPRYCFFGDTVNTASRMESNGYAQAVHCSPATHDLTKHLFDFATVPRRHIKGKGPMETYLLKHGEWELAHRALLADAAAAPPLERAGSVPILTDLPKEAPTALLKQTVGRRSRAEAELQAAKALARTESAPADFEVPGDATGDPGSTGLVLDMAVGGRVPEDKGKEDGEKSAEEKAPAQSETENRLSDSRIRASSEPVPPLRQEVDKRPPVQDPGTQPSSKLAADEPPGVSPVADASARARFTSLRITPPGGPLHPASPRIRSPLSRSYSSPDLKVLINREAFQAAYPESSPSLEGMSPAPANGTPSPKPSVRSTSAGGSLGSTPVSESERRVSDGSPKLELHSTKFVQVGKTAWVLKRPPSISGAKGDPAAPIVGFGVAGKAAAPPAAKDTRMEHLKMMLGSDPGSYVRRLSDTSIISDLDGPHEDGGPPERGTAPAGVPAADGSRTKAESERAGRPAETSLAKETPSAKDSEVKAHTTKPTAEKSPPSTDDVSRGAPKREEKRKEEQATEKAPPRSLPVMVQRNLAAALEGPAAGGGGVLGASGSLRQYSRVSRTELVCLAASSCGFSDPHSRDVSNSGTPEGSKRPSFETPEGSKRSSLEERDPPVGGPVADPAHDKGFSHLRPGQDDRAPPGVEQQVCGRVGEPGRKPRWSGRDPSPLKPRPDIAGIPLNLTRLEEEVKPLALPLADRSMANVEEEFPVVTKPSLENGTGTEANGTLSNDQGVSSDDEQVAPLTAKKDGSRSPERSPRRYTDFAPAPLRVATSSAHAAHRRSVSQWLPERNSPPGAPPPQPTGSPAQRTKAEALAQQPGQRRKTSVVSPGGSSQDRSPEHRAPERPVPDPLSSQTRAAAAAVAAARGIKVPAKPRLAEGVELDAATLERLTEAITEQVLSHLGTPRGSTSSISSSRGSPSGQDRAQRSLSASPLRGAGWGPWRVPARGIPLDEASRDSSGKTSPGGSRSPRGRMAFTEFAAHDDGWAREESRFASDPAYPGAAASSLPIQGRHVAGFPWQLELTRSYSEDGVAARYERDRSEARAPPGGWADVASDVSSGSWSSFESTYTGGAPGFDRYRPEVTSAEGDDLQARGANGARLADASGNGHLAGGRDAPGEIARFLTGLGLGHYLDTLEQEEVTLAVLSRLTLQQLKEVGVHPLGARMRILEAFKARTPH